jgi:hypothetical protein
LIACHTSIEPIAENAMSDTTLRHLAMLQLIPAHPGKITARDIHRRLSDEGYAVDVRSVERDLHKLSQKLALVQDDGHPSGWSWSNATRTQLGTRHACGHRIDVRVVVAVCCERDAARAATPAGTRVQARPPGLVPLSGCGLRALGPSASRRCRNPTRCCPRILLRASSTSSTTACCLAKQFRVDYRSPYREEPSTFEVNPLGLVQTGSVLYLIVRIEGFADARHLALHRMSKAVALDTPATAPKGFDFDRHVREEKQFEYPSGDTIKLELVMDSVAGAQSRRVSPVGRSNVHSLAR